MTSLDPTHQSEPTIRDVLRRYGLVLAGGLVLVLGLGAVLTGGSDVDPAQAQAVIDGLETDRVEADTALDEAYATLAGSIPGLDEERVRRDQQTGRTLALTLASSPSSSQSLREQQIRLLKQWPFITRDSDVLIRFLPELYEATSPTTFRLEQLDLHVLGVAGLDYTYLGQVLLVPAELDVETIDDVEDAADVELVMIRFTTQQDGQVTWLDASRGSSEARDNAVAEAFDTDSETSAGEEAGSPPSPSAEEADDQDDTEGEQ